MAAAEELTLKQRVGITLARPIFGLLLRLNRLSISGEEHLREAIAAKQPVYVGIWHGRFLMTLWYLRRFKPAILVSRSRDGEMIARILKGWGYKLVRGSSRDGGTSALRRVLSLFEEDTALLAVTMDGPTGPPYISKVGSIAAAARQGARFVPLAAGASRRWVFSKSWDHFQLPMPLGNIVIKAGPAVIPEAGQTDDAFAALFAEKVTQLEEEADRIARPAT